MNCGPTLLSDVFANAAALRGAVVVALGFGLAATCVRGAAATPGDTLYVQVEGAGVRQAPRAEAELLAVLEQGRKLKEFRRADGWVKVLIYGTLGQDGWLPAADVGPVSPFEVSDDPPAAERQDSEPTRSPAVATGGTDSAPRFVLRIGGPASFPDRFRATCRIVNAAGRVVYRKMAGVAPAAYRFVGKAASCGVRKGSKPGRLRVTLERAGRIVAADATRQAFGHVQVRSRGPWGRARSLRCNPTRRVCIE